MSSPQVNDKLILLVGKAANGKSMSLRTLANPESVMYLNMEAGKKLPFKSKFKEYTITDPVQQLPQAFAAAEKNADIHTIIIDSLTYMMDMVESLYVLPSDNTQKAWGDFAQFFKTLMQGHVARSSKNIIFTAHVKDELNNEMMVRETSVPIKGSLKNNGIESYFSCIIAAKKVSLKALEEYQNPLLNITPREEAIGVKYVFQTQITKDTVNERLRGPLDLFQYEETFIDSDMQQVLTRLNEYYQ